VGINCAVCGWGKGSAAISLAKARNRKNRLVPYAIASG
jgi:hypothetical protein